MLALLSPPEDSERTPGMERNSSAALVACVARIWSSSIVETERLCFIFEPCVAVAVITTRSRSSAFLSSGAACANAWMDIVDRALVTASVSNFLGNALIMMASFCLNQMGVNVRMCKTRLARSWFGHRLVVLLFSSLSINKFFANVCNKMFQTRVDVAFTYKKC